MQTIGSFIETLSISSESQDVKKSLLINDPNRKIASVAVMWMFMKMPSIEIGLVLNRNVPTHIDCNGCACF